MPADVFVSYARQDIDWVGRLAATLGSRGVSVWWDRRLLAGQSFEALIDAKLAAAPAVIVVWSEASTLSDWVKDEAAEGRRIGRLIPVSIDGSRPPFGFRQIHTLDLSGWDGRADAAQIDELVEALHASGVETEAIRQDTETHPRVRQPAGGADDEATWFIPRDLRPGEEIAQFRIVRKLGQGGFGAAYEAVNLHNERERVVVKVLLPDMAARETFADLLKSEADALQRVKHDAVVQYRTFGRLRASDEFFLAVEYIDGPTLAEWRKTHTPSMGDILALAARLKSGLDAVHAQGVVHRDLSPDNVILPNGRLDRATIIDFGIARHGTVDALSGGFAGKLSWASPEQLDPGVGKIGPWTDFYSLGLILAFLARGTKLPIGGSMDAAREARLNVPSLEGINPDLAAIITGLLQPQPFSRQAAFSEEGSGPGRHRPDAETSASAPSSFEAPSSSRSYRRSAIAAAAVMMLAITAIAAVYAPWRSDHVQAHLPPPEPTPEPDSPALLLLPADIRSVVRRAEAVAEAARAIEQAALKGTDEALAAYEQGLVVWAEADKHRGQAWGVATDERLTRCVKEDFAEGDVFCRSSDDKTKLWFGQGSCSEAGCVLDGHGYYHIDGGYPYWRGLWRDGELVLGQVWEVGEMMATVEDKPLTTYTGAFAALKPHGYASGVIGSLFLTGRFEAGNFAQGCTQSMLEIWADDIPRDAKRSHWVCADFAKGGLGSAQISRLDDNEARPQDWSDRYFQQMPQGDFVLARFSDQKPVGPVVIYRRDGARVETARNADGAGLGNVVFADGSRYVGEIDDSGRSHGVGALYAKNGTLERAGKWSEGQPADL